MSWDELTQEERDDFREDARRRAVYLPEPDHWHKYEPLAADLIAGLPYEDCRFRCVTFALPRCKHDVISYAELRARRALDGVELAKWIW